MLINLSHKIKITKKLTRSWIIYLVLSLFKCYECMTSKFTKVTAAQNGLLVAELNLNLYLCCAFVRRTLMHSGLLNYNRMLILVDHVCFRQRRISCVSARARRCLRITRIVYRVDTLALYYICL